MFECLDPISKYWKFIRWAGILLIFPSYILFSNLHIAIQRGSQKRNLADMRAIGTAIEAYGVDHKVYPPGNSTVSALKKYLEPVYIKELPRKDSWGNYFLYEASDDLQSYTITSYGKDHKPDPVAKYVGVITRFTNDIRFSNGSFIAFPEGI